MYVPLEFSDEAFHKTPYCHDSFLFQLTTAAVRVVNVKGT